MKDRNIEKEILLTSTKIPVFDFRRKMIFGKQLVKLTAIGSHEPVVLIELNDLRLEFPEIKARKIPFPSVDTDLVSPLQ